MRRREFFKIMGLVSGAAISGCKNEDSAEKILPYLVPPEDDIIPGVPRYVKSSCTECPAGCGTDVKIINGNPIKLEGNDQHPVNKGALCARGQAAISRLYDPERIKQPLLKNPAGVFEPVSWDKAILTIRDAVEKAKIRNRKNLFMSSETSGSISNLIMEFCIEMNAERVADIDLIHQKNIKKANKILLNRDIIPGYMIDKADTLLTLGADLLGTFLSPVKWSWQIQRAIKENNLKWHHLEPYLTLTGASATSRAVIKPGTESVLLSYLIHNLKIAEKLPLELVSQVPSPELNEVMKSTGLSALVISRIIEDLQQARKPLIICGGPSAAGEEGLLSAFYTTLLQVLLEMPGKTISFEQITRPEEPIEFDLFEQKYHNREFGLLFLNRIYNLYLLPRYGKLIERASFKVALADRMSKIHDQCDLLLPVSHTLESWGDTIPEPGIMSLIQPVLEPLQESKNEGDILLQIMGKNIEYREYLAKNWQANTETMITNGFFRLKPKDAEIELVEKVKIPMLKIPSPKDCIYFVPSVRSYDGRSADLPLMSEIPDPLTSISYGDCLLVSKGLAAKNDLNTGDWVEISLKGKTVEIPVMINPGTPEGIVTASIELFLQFGLESFSSLDDVLKPFWEPTFKALAKKTRLSVLAGANKTGKRRILPYEGSHGTHEHHNTEHQQSLYPPHEHKNYRWGMVIDLDACNGCSACVAACYIENNIPLTGETEHQRGREMSWLRIEPYYGSSGIPEFLPVMCQQCDNAPCEPVCPVYATYHNEEGLNAQVYNRCVGTRYCANNCPYKVRRFNWFDNRKKLPMYSTSNPDLSVRPAGVMEKCSFCIQRIRFAKDKAKDEKRLVKDGEVITACAQTCPGRAISFGNLDDPGSKVSKLLKSAAGHRILEELGTEPAVYYIKKKRSKKSLLARAGENLKSPANKNTKMEIRRG